MIFTCEVCGVGFSTQEECVKHEKQCREHNQSALNMAYEINALIGSAQAQKFGLGVEVVTTEKDQTKTEFKELLDCEFMHAKNRIVIRLKQNEKPEEPTKKSSKKS